MPWSTSNSEYGNWWKHSQQLKPKVNAGAVEAPVRVGLAKEKDDRSVLQLKLDKYALVERVMAGDGNCQFRALADQIYGDSKQHDAVRREVVAQLRSVPERYCEYIPGSYELYTNTMAHDGTWGDHVTLQACADRYGSTIYLLTSYDDDKVIEVVPEKVKSDQALWLAFWAEIHYNSVGPKSTSVDVVGVGNRGGGNYHTY